MREYEAQSNGEHTLPPFANVPNDLSAHGHGAFFPPEFPQEVSHDFQPFDGGDANDNFARGHDVSIHEFFQPQFPRDMSHYVATA